MQEFWQHRPAWLTAGPNRVSNYPVEHKAKPVLQDSLPPCTGHGCPLRARSGGTWRLREHTADSPDPELSLTRP